MSTAADWSESEIALCVKLRLDGRSTAEIGREIGRSKNSVIGIMHRNRDLFPIVRPEAITRASAERAERNKQARLRHHVATTTSRPIVERPPVLPDEPIIEAAAEFVPAEPVTFLAVSDRQCKWPLWRLPENPGGAGLCCGASIEFGAGYCARHRLLAYGPGTRSERAADRDLARAAR